MRKGIYILFALLLIFSCKEEDSGDEKVSLSNAVLSLVKDGNEEKTFKITVQVKGNPTRVSMDILNTTIYKDLTFIARNANEYEYPVLYIRKAELEFPSGSTLQCRIFADDVSILTNRITITWQEPQNMAPSTPKLKSPEDNTPCSPENQVFEWDDAVDAEHDTFHYQLQIATDKNFNDIYTTKNYDTSKSEGINLPKGQAYYWRVKAIDEHNAESNYSSAWGFYVEGDPTSNHVPKLEYISPEHGKEINTTNVQMSWKGTDADNHELTYKLYLQKNDEGYVEYTPSGTTFEIQLEAGNNYYWYVIVSDGVSENQGIKQHFSIAP